MLPLVLDLFLSLTTDDISSDVSGGADTDAAGGSFGEARGASGGRAARPRRGHVLAFLRENRLDACIQLLEAAARAGP